MKWIIALWFALAVPLVAAPAVSPGLPISQYPNRGTPQGPDLFILAVTNQTPKTNMNISFNQVSNAIVSGIPPGVGFAFFESLTNGTRVGLSTNQNWVSGVTGLLNGTTVELGVDIFNITNGLGPIAPGVGLAPGTATITVDGSVPGILNRTSVLTSAASIIFENLVVGLPIRWWGFASNGAWTISVPQSHTSNTLGSGIEQPFSNTWVMVEATATAVGWTNFNSAGQLYSIGPGTNVVFDTNFVTGNIAVSAAGASGGFVSFESLTNSVRLGLTTNQNWVSGVTGLLSGTTAILGVDIRAITNGLGDRPFETLTNGVRVGLTTNNNWVSYVTGIVSGTTVTLGVDGAAILASIAFKTNQFTTNVADVAGGFQTPVIGSLWFGGTNGTVLTNGARVGIEWIPVMRALRIGELGGGIHPSNLGGEGTNYWNATNIGVMSIAIGSNTMAKARFSTVSGGSVNLILTNSDHSTIAGGYRNFIDTNSITSFIGGGGFNQLYGTATEANNRNRVIVGGSNNIINGPITKNSFIGGGQDNDIITDGDGYATIVGGFSNSIKVGGQFSFLGGGNDNRIDADTAASDSESAVLVGGQANIARGDYTFIGGGRGNNLLARDDDASVIVGGVSNTIGVATASESTHALIGGGFQNAIANGSHFSSIVGGFQNQMAGLNTNSFIGGGYINIIDSGGNACAIVSGIQNSITGNGDYGFISGGVSNRLDAAYTAAVGHFLTNTTTKSVEIGITNTSKMRVEAFSTRMIGMGTLYQSNSFALPSAATIGVGGYWVGNSNGVLVSLKSLDGTTTAMKILDQ